MIDLLLKNNLFSIQLECIASHCFLQYETVLLFFVVVVDQCRYPWRAGGPASSSRPMSSSSGFNPYASSFVVVVALGVACQSGCVASSSSPCCLSCRRCGLLKQPNIVLDHPAPAPRRPYICICSTCCCWPWRNADRVFDLSLVAAKSVSRLVL
jgi:hypothetical protein